MKKVYKIFTINTKAICVPSDSYYASKGDWQAEGIEYLTPCFGEFETEEDACKEAMTYNVGTKLVILPVYTVIQNPFL